ncbi:MAG: GLPGLI family protein [Bacteroidales bacterium]|nr:GLPGLI family protein [Bacteroidales bacterium]
MKLPITFFLQLFVFATFAQNIAGVIEYEFTMDLHRNIPPGREAMKAMIPQHHTSHFQLFFNEEESLYRIMEDEESALQAGRQGGGMRMMMQGMRSETYTSKKDRKILVQQDVMGTTYLIEEPLEIGQWRVGDEILEIAGYSCMMAWYTDTVLNQEVTAWFTMELPAFTGPERYVTLPGTVLAVDINNGERVWVARNIQLEAAPEVEIQPPTRGRKLTRDEFNAMLQEQRERMNNRGTPLRF